MFFPTMSAAMVDDGPSTLNLSFFTFFFGFSFSVPEESLVFLLFEVVAVLDFLVACAFSEGAVAVPGAGAGAVAIAGAGAFTLVIVASAGAVAVAAAGNAGGVGVEFSVMVEENAGAASLVSISTLALEEDGNNSAVLDGGGGGTSS